jgi:hypothetical protein
VHLVTHKYMKKKHRRVTARRLTYESGKSGHRDRTNLGKRIWEIVRGSLSLVKSNCLARGLYLNSDPNLGVQANIGETRVTVSRLSQSLRTWGSRDRTACARSA